MLLRLNHHQKSHSWRRAYSALNRIRRAFRHHHMTRAYFLFDWTSYPSLFLRALWITCKRRVFYLCEPLVNPIFWSCRHHHHWPQYFLLRYAAASALELNEHPLYGQPFFHSLLLPNSCPSSPCIWYCHQVKNLKLCKSQNGNWNRALISFYHLDRNRLWLHP